MTDIQSPVMQLSETRRAAGHLDDWEPRCGSSLFGTMAERCLRSSQYATLIVVPVRSLISSRGTKCKYAAEGGGGAGH